MAGGGVELEAIAEYYETHELTEDEIMGAEPGEPVAAESVMIATSLRLPKPVMDEVRRRARERGLTPTAIMREWIEAAVAVPDEVVPLSVVVAAAARYQQQERAARVDQHFRRARHWEALEAAEHLHRAEKTPR
ncbi:hypothetical protein [Streptomyces sp. FH025]|uniref:hypothetical protein n=1 Tax=Streptomyces sp. FH025 TaxID=2815937 RepID=UPI001A9E2FC4|nr:hypothetical protein [Streptomyces sp. FH025]MBO1416181.1 hypothetical protein [Streptomyces sp. FH025]